jgi:prealbumin domain-containing protein
MAKRMLGPSGGKRRRSLRWLLPLVVLLITLSVSVFTQAGGAVLSVSNPPAFTFVNDEQGADDQPGQKDLSAQAVAVPAPGDLWVAWKWDVTSLSGGNTGDACALFDTNTNSKINFAICVTIAGNPAVQSGVSPRVYTCGDGKVDRCTSTATQVATINSACGTTTTASDPFHSGQQDTEAYCHIDLADVGGATTANLVNTCSYPSQQPNSDPSDCVLIPRDAFIRIAKTASPDSGSFPFNLDASLAFTAAGTQTSSYIAITSGTTHPHSVQEAVPTGWSITGTPSCTGASGSNGTYSSTTKTISGIVASADNQITCSFSDQQQRATVDVSKTGSDSGAQTGAVFTLYPGPDNTGTPSVTCTVIASGHCGATSPSFSNLLPGQYTLDETTAPGGYTKPATLPSTFTLTAGQAYSVSFEDAAQPGSITISKLDDQNNGVEGATFTLYQPASGTTDPPTGTAVTGGSCQTDSTGACTISNLASGSYTIDEAPPTGYAKDSNFPKNVTVSRGTTTNVSATDAKLFKVIVLVCQKTDDSLYASKVKFDAAALPTSNNTPTSVDSSIDETKLCQLSGTYVHDSAQRNHDHTATIQIP